MTAVYRLSRKGIAFITLNNPPVNAMNLAVREAILEGLEMARKDDILGLVLQGDGNIFTGGADIMEFTMGTYMKQPHLHDVISEIDKFERPLATYLKGQTMGGGVEISLASHFRVANKTTKMGLPEVHLGLLPGAGGTQRLPRLVGANKALEIITSGRSLEAAEALKIGMIDHIIDSDGNKQALGKDEEKLEEWMLSPQVLEANLQNRSLSKQLYKGETLEVSKNVNINPKAFMAPSLIYTTISAATSTPFDKGIQIENKLFQDLMKSTQAKAMMTIFFGGNSFKKRNMKDEFTQQIVGQLIGPSIKELKGILNEKKIGGEQLKAILKDKLGFVLDLGFPLGPEKDTKVDLSDEDEEAVVERIMYPIVNESLRLLEENNKFESTDIDIVFIHKFGFPRHCGGPLFWAENEIGFDKVFEGLKKHGENEGGTYWEPCDLLIALAENGAKVKEELHFRRQ